MPGGSGRTYSSGGLSSTGGTGPGGAAAAESSGDGTGPYNSNGQPSGTARGGGNSPDGGPTQYGNYTEGSNSPGSDASGVSAGGNIAGAGAGNGPAVNDANPPAGADGNSGGTAASGPAGGGGAAAGGSSQSPYAPSDGGSPSSSSGGAAGSTSASDPNTGTTPNISATVPAGPGEYVESMARTRGKNWGLPESSRNSTPLTRPIQMYCSADQLTLFSDRGVPDKQIPLAGRTQESVDLMVSQVWDHVKAWGIAGRGMYWKPVLSVHVAPDGTARFNELKQLLEGSGLEVTGKQITLAAPVGSPARR